LRDNWNCLMLIQDLVPAKEYQEIGDGKKPKLWDCNLILKYLSLLKIQA